MPGPNDPAAESAEAPAWTQVLSGVMGAWQETDFRLDETALRNYRHAAAGTGVPAEELVRMARGASGSADWLNAAPSLLRCTG